MRGIHRHARRAAAWIVVLAGAPIAAAPSLADIAPRYYREWQERATEAVTIRVLSVRTSVTREKRPGANLQLVHTRVQAQARVEKVDRTRSGLKPGMTIRLDYVSTQADPPVMAGPRPIPIVKAGETYPAFLYGVSPGIYGAAARGASFQPLIKLE